MVIRRRSVESRLYAAGTRTVIKATTLLQDIPLVIVIGGTA